MLSFSLNSLLVFCAVAKFGSFSKAAEALFMTQPGVSNHVKQLEAQIGKKLIVRGKNGIHLTGEGKTVFKYAERIDSLAEELERYIRNVKKEESVVLRIAITTVYSKVLIPTLLGSFIRNYPNVTIKLDLANTQEMLGKVLKGEVDCAILANAKRSKRIEVVPLVREELVLITDKAHPLSAYETVSLKEIAKFPLIMREEGSATRKVVLQAFESLRIKPSIVFEVKSTEFIKEWVMEGRGISILINRAISEEEKKHMNVIKIEEPLYLEVSIVFLKSNRTNHAIERFVNHIEELKSKSLLCS
ncbi:MAG: LysR family transcriptional regulator [Desulfobacterota bacterium]|nr:LysR family transcriptional regulator [Thermodesulfobacteriota bacterium]MDW8001875.1 LysR family transcriptional regulator [Deltaproteobacteria bacterium]